MFGDAKFRKLTPPPPCGQYLWIWLIIGDKTIAIPGVIVGREAELAGAIGWSLEGFREAFAEVFREGMAEADWEAGLVTLPKALITSSGTVRESTKPASPNVVKSWGRIWSELPDSPLKLALRRRIMLVCEALGRGFHEAFYQGFGEGLSEGLPEGSPIQVAGDQVAGSRIQDPRESVPDLFGDRPSKPKKGSRSKAQISEQWGPNEKHHEQAADLGVNLAVELDRFRDWAAAKGQRFADWDAAFRNWLRKASEFQQQRSMSRAAPHTSGFDRVLDAVRQNRKDAAR